MSPDQAAGDRARSRSDRPRWAIVVASLVILCAVIVLSEAAYAHDGEATSSPADGETVGIGEVDTAEIFFGQAATDPRVELLGPAGERIPADLTSQDEGSVIFAFDALTDTGNYQLRWFAQAADDHPITGAATFSVGEDTKPGARKPPRTLLLVLGSIGVAAAVGFAICATWQRSR